MSGDGTSAMTDPGNGAATPVSLDGAAAELATLRVLRAIAGRFTETWAELLPALPADHGCGMACDQANAAADLFRAFGDDDIAARILAAHGDCAENYHGPGAAG